MVDDELQAALDAALDGKPSSEEIGLMVAALQDRRATFQREHDAAAEGDRSAWAAKLREVDGQIAVLRQERAITQFVENSVRVALGGASVDEEG